MKRVFKLKKDTSYGSDISAFIEKSVAAGGNVKKNYKIEVNITEEKAAKKPAAKAKAKAKPKAKKKK